MLELREHQQSALQKLKEGFEQGHARQLLYAPTGAGKCLGKDTPVLMFDGTIKKVQDVCVGDVLMGPDSTPRNVLSTASGVSQLYKVTPTKGEPYIVNDAHILSLKITNGATKYDCSRSDRYKAGKIHNICVTDYLKESKTFKHVAKGWRTGVNFSSKNQLPLDPYFLGIWIGDGTSSQVAITSADEEILQYVQDLAQKLDMRYSVYAQKNNQSVVAYIVTREAGCRNPVKSALRDLRVLSNKHIPRCYLTASREDRLQLLAGILDTDGSLDKSGFDITQKNERIARDILFLARSLGFAAYIKECTKTCTNNGKSGIYWRVNISGDCDEIPTKIPHKKSPARKQIKDPLLVGIKVEDAGVGEYYGFQIDGDKLFLLGDFTVTHNTECAIAIMNEYAMSYQRSAMVMDRIVLVEQTSLRLGKYQIDHGVMQSSHWRYRPSERIQICSIQTLAKRKKMATPDLLLYDETHVLHKSIIDYIKNNPQMKVIGLTATPFTKGLANLYTNVVSAIPTEKLVEKGLLCPLKVYIAKEIDMTGAKKIAGEWSADDVTTRGMKITGDIVSEWVKKTHEVFGEPKKTIVFCSGVDHGRDLEKQFNAAGYNFVSISYKEDDDFKRMTIEDFSRPDTTINGLIATDILTKGFDVSDVRIGISARPFSKSFSSHVQQIGRILRPHEGKDFALWLDHAGNYIRFRDDWDEVYANGVSELREGGEATKKEPTEREKKEAKCPKCQVLWTFKSDACGACGFIKVRMSTVEAVPGELKELEAANKKLVINNQEFYSQLIWYAQVKGYKTGWAYHKYKEKFNSAPNGLSSSPKHPSPEVLNWIKSRTIAFAKAKAKAA